MVDGKIKDVDKFQHLVDDVVDMARGESATKTYWWSMSHDQSRFSDLDTYDNTAAAVAHVGHWAKHNDEFELCAQNERLIVLGDVEQPIRDALSAMNPHFMGFYGGFAKDKPIEADHSTDIIWSFEGRITDKKMFREAMERLVPLTQAESGAMLYWWCTDEEDRFFVLERYLNSNAAIVHMNNSSEFGKLFFGSTEVVEFRIYSDVSPELKEILSPLNPLYMSYYAGFSR